MYIQRAADGRLLDLVDALLVAREGREVAEPLAALVALVRSLVLVHGDDVRLGGRRMDDGERQYGKRRQSGASTQSARRGRAAYLQVAVPLKLVEANRARVLLSLGRARVRRLLPRRERAAGSLRRAREDGLPVARVRRRSCRA